MDEEKVRAAGNGVPPVLSGFLGALVIAVLTWLLFAVASRLDSQYGYAVLAGIPLVLGFFCALIVGSEGKLTYWRCGASAM